MMSLLFSVFLGKTTEGVPTDPCKEATPSSIASTKTFSEEEIPVSTSVPKQDSLTSEDNSGLLTDLNKTLHKLPLEDFEKVLTPPSYEDQPSLWPILEHPASRPCLEVNPVDWSISSTMTPPHDLSCVASTPQQNIQPPRKLEEGVFDIEMDREKAAMDMLGVEEHEDYVTYDPILWKLWQEQNCEQGSRFCLQLVITPQVRSQFLAWLSSQATRCGCSLEAWCLAVNYLDRFMCEHSMSVADYGLAGVTALLIASKKVDPEPASVERLAVSTASSNSFGPYCKAEFITQMEVILLDALSGQLDVPTIPYFLNHLSQGIRTQDWQTHVQRHLVEMVLRDRLLSKYPPSKVALAIFDMTKVLNSHLTRSVSPVCHKCDPSSCNQDEEDLVDRLFEDLAAVLVQFR